MSDQVYVVFREGVYRHECGGVFTQPREAVDCAVDLAAADIDDYHEYRVMLVALGVRAKWVRDENIKTPESYYAWDMDEPLTLYYKVRHTSAVRLMAERRENE